MNSIVMFVGLVLFLLTVAAGIVVAVKDRRNRQSQQAFEARINRVYECTSRRYTAKHGHEHPSLKVLQGGRG